MSFFEGSWQVDGLIQKGKLFHQALPGSQSLQPLSSQLQLIDPQSQDPFLSSPRVSGSQSEASQTGASAVSRNLIEMHNLRPRPRPTESQTLGVGPRNLHL